MHGNKWLRTALCGSLLVLLTACSGSADLSEGFSLSERPLIGKIVWHDLMTDDPVAARNFYGELLGWSFLETERPNGGPYLLARSGRRFVAGMIEVPDPLDGGEYSRWLGYLSVADVDQAVALAVESGGSAVIQPRQIGQVGRGAVIRDPGGAPIGLLRSNRGDPDDGMLGLPGTIGWNELLADHAGQASEFYARLTDLETRTEQRRKGAYHVLSDGEQDRAGIFDNPLEGVDPAWLAHFMVDDLAAAVAQVPRLGGEILLPPSEALRDGSMALVLDPSGALLALSQAR